MIAPSLLKNMADALVVSTGELKAMASDGSLTTEVLIKAFENMKDKVESDFKSYTAGGRSWITNLQTRILEQIYFRILERIYSRILEQIYSRIR